MSWFDGHLDLAYVGVRGRDLTRSCDDPANASQPGCITVPDLRAGGVTHALTTIYIDIGEPASPWGYASSDDVDGAERAALRQIDHYESLERAGHIRIVRTKRDLDHPDAGEPSLRIIMLMEGADPIRTPAHVRQWFDRGVRVVGLTWAKGSRYAGGNATGGPLTREGRELIAAMDELGMVHDVSHLADEACGQLLAAARGPVVASHSNCRSLLSPDQRHITDDVIREVARRGGVIGLNLYGRFLAKDRRATLDDALRHVEHIASIVGHRRACALGSDADGGFTPADLPDGLDHPSKWQAMASELGSRGWAPADIAAFQRENWLRVMRAALPA
jgi:membrane dipeptidase